MLDATACLVFWYRSAAEDHDAELVGKPLDPPLAPLWSARRCTYRILYVIDDTKRLVEPSAMAASRGRSVRTGSGADSQWTLRVLSVSRPAPGTCPEAASGTGGTSEGAVGSSNSCATKTVSYATTTLPTIQHCLSILDNSMKIDRIGHSAQNGLNSNLTYHRVTNLSRPRLKTRPARHATCGSPTSVGLSLPFTQCNRYRRFSDEPTDCPVAVPRPAVSVLRELLATVRCARLSAGSLALWRFSRRPGHEILAQVDVVVMPLVDKTINDPNLRDWVRGAFRTAAIKFGVGVWGYTEMAGRPPDFSLIALATSFTRLYDDLMDHASDGSDVSGFDERFEQLLRGERLQPTNRLEHLMQELFLALEVAAGPGRADPLYTDVAGVHRWQRQSRRQRHDPSITAAELDEITQGKGSLGVLVLYTLGHDEVSEEERDVIRHIGAVGQMLDDQHDLPIDRIEGIATPATLSHHNAWIIGGEVARLAARLRRHFGPRRARSFEGLLFLYLAGLIFRRERVRRRYPPVAITPWRILIGHTRDIPSDNLGRDIVSPMEFVASP